MSGGRLFLPRRVCWEPWGVLLSGVLLWMSAGSCLWLLLLAALIHEAGHLLCAGLLACPVACLHLGLMGARLELERSLESYPREAAVALSGAAANLLAAIPAFFAVRAGGGEGSLFFLFANLALGAINLLPAEGLDGGLLLYALAAQCADPFTAYRLLRLGTLGSLALTAAGSLWLFRISGRNLSVLVLCAGLLLRLWGKKEKRPQ